MAHFFAVVATHSQAQFAQRQILNTVYTYLANQQHEDVNLRLLVPKEIPLNCTVFDGDIPVTDFLDAYKVRGIGCFTHLSGLYQGVSFDAVEQRWLIFNSPFHPTPLYVCEYMNCLIVTQRLDLLTLFVTPKVSHSALSLWLSGRPDPNISMFENINVLPFAHVGSYIPSDTYNDKPLALQRFWDIEPDAEVRYHTLSEYAEHWRSLLQYRVSHDCELAKGAIACQLSGGMDSTSITALVQQTLLHDPDRYAQTPLHTLSHTYTRTQSCDESDLIDAMVQHLSLQHQHTIELDQFADTAFNDLYPTQLASPGTVHSPKYAQELELYASLGVDTLFTGNGGDEMAWGHSLIYADRIIKGDLSVIGDVVNTAKALNMPVFKSLLQVLVKPNLPDKLLSLLGKLPTHTTELPLWLGATAREHIEALEVHNPFEGTLGTQGLASRYEGVMQTATFNSMRSYESLSRHMGINVRHPFFDPALAAYSFSIPQHYHIQADYPKYLLRTAMNGLLPEAVCWNKHKVIFDQHFANIVRNNRQSLRELLSHRGLQDLGLVNNALVLSAFDAVVNDPNGSLNVNLLYTILTQSWYQQHIVGS